MDTSATNTLAKIAGKEARVTGTGRRRKAISDLIRTSANEGSKNEEHSEDNKNVQTSETADQSAETKERSLRLTADTKIMVRSDFLWKDWLEAFALDAYEAPDSKRGIPVPVGGIKDNKIILEKSELRFLSSINELSLDDLERLVKSSNILILDAQLDKVVIKANDEVCNVDVQLRQITSDFEDINMDECKLEYGDDQLRCCVIHRDIVCQMGVRNA